MPRNLKPIERSLLTSSFDLFVRHAFRAQHGESLGNQPYVQHMCHVVSRFIEEYIWRLLVNLPPQHLKSFVCTICLSAFLLLKNDRLRILLVAYNDAFAEALASRIKTSCNQSGIVRPVRHELRRGTLEQMISGRQRAAESSRLALWDPLQVAPLT